MNDDENIAESSEAGIPEDDSTPSKPEDVDAFPVDTPQDDRTSSGVGDNYAFLVVYGRATVRFNVPVGYAKTLVEDFNELAKKIDFKTQDGSDERQDEIRSMAKEIVRLGILDNDHMDVRKSSSITNCVVWLCLTNETYRMSQDSRGFIVEITETSGNNTNFRFIITDEEVVDEFTMEARRGLKYVLNVDQSDIRKASQRKRMVSRDPSLDPPPKPRPEHWLGALVAMEKSMGRSQFVVARDCLENGNMFVWRSRQIADASAEEINASLQAMAEYNRLHLPFKRIWAETRDWLEVPQNDAPMKQISARFAIAADEYDGIISFWGFADANDTVAMSAISGVIDMKSLSGGQRNYTLVRPTVPDAITWDEGWHRRITKACGDHLLELLFLLSTNGVVRQHVGDGVKPGKRRKEQRRMTARDYTIVRVPMSRTEGGSSKGDVDGEGSVRWVRPHVRRAHMWGKNVRPPEEQRWIEACLVGASRDHSRTAIKRREYHLG